MAPGGARLLQPWRTPFVGRGSDLATLMQLLEAAERRQGGIVLIAGEPGIGKTRIAEELCAMAEQRGCAVYWGQCFEGEGAPAFWPWVQILRTWILPFDADALRPALGRRAADLALILPDLVDLIADLPQSTPLDPAQARFRLFDSVATFLHQTVTRPSVLVLDDLHWADEPSLLLLEFLAAQLTDDPILVIGIYRDLDLTPGHVLSTTLGHLARRPQVQRLVLGRLSPTEVAQFVDATPGVHAAELLSETLLTRAEGNPLFVGEMLRLVQSQHCEPGAESAMLTAVPPTLRDVIGRRLSRLSEECRRVLTVAAVIGREVDLITLRAVFPDEADQTIDALEEAEAARIIVEVAASAPTVRYQFTHALVRDTLYEALRASHRARLHLRVGMALERMPAHSTHSADARLAELAHHFVQAAPVARPDEVLQHVYRAAERAVHRLAFEEGARLYLLALQVLDTGPMDNQEARCDLLLRLGAVQLWLTDDPASRSSYLAVADLARALGPTIGQQRAAHLLAQAALGYSGMARLEVRSLDERGIGLLQEALAAIGNDDNADRARLLARLGTARSWTDASNATGTESLQAVEVARRVGDAHALADALVSRYYSMAIGENLDEAMVLCGEVAALADQIGNPFLMTDSKRRRIRYLLEVGELAAADATLAEYDRMMRDLGYPYAEWRMAVANMSRALLVGELDAANQAAHEAARLGPTQPRQGTPWFVSGELHLLRVEQGDLTDALRLLDELRREYPRAHGVRSARAWVLSETGDLEEARRELTALAAHDFADLRHGGAWNYSITFLAQLCANLADGPRAALLYDILLLRAEAVSRGGWRALHGAPPDVTTIG